MMVIFLWLTLVYLIISRSIHVAANGIISFFDSWVVFHCVCVCIIHMCVCVCVCVYTPHLLHPFTYWWTFTLLHVLATVNSAVTGEHVPLWSRVFLRIYAHISAYMLDHIVTLFLVFKGTSISFPKVAVPIYIPTNSVGGLPFLHTLSGIYYL